MSVPDWFWGVLVAYLVAKTWEAIVNALRE